MQSFNNTNQIAATTLSAAITALTLLLPVELMGQDAPLTQPVKPKVELLENVDSNTPGSTDSSHGATNSSVFGKSGSYELNPHTFTVNPQFDADKLPTNTMKQAHADWWIAYNDRDNHFQSDPDVMFSPADINNWKANGSYTLARHGGNFLYTIVDLIRTTGDPKALNELVGWSVKIRDLLKDHDGRGYEYFEYSAVVKSDPEDGKHNLDDTQWLDEHMLGGMLAHIAHVMHVNREYSTDAGEEADFWFKYLDENWLPKWLYRTTYGTSNQYTPPDHLKLRNAVNWDGGVGGTGGNAGDIVLWGGPDDPRYNDIPGLKHKFPAHMFAHSYIMSIQQYLVMGQYFTDMNKKPVSAYVTGTAQDFFDEAKTRSEWWHEKVIYRSDGSIFWPHFLTTQQGTQRTDVYSMFVAYYVHLSHWMKIGKFAGENHPAGHAKTWYSDVYAANNVTTMKARNDGSGGDISFILSFAGLLGCWDNTGTLLNLNQKAIISPTSHHMPANKSSMSTIWHHNIHHNTILSCELKNLSK